MEDINFKLYKYFETLPEDDRIDRLQQIIDAHNLNLSNTRFLELKAPARLNTRSRRSYIICRCGHDYNVHALDEIWEDGGCRIHDCRCEKFSNR